MRLIAVAAGLLVVGLAMPAFAENEVSCHGSGQRMTHSQIESAYKKQGYDVRSIKEEGGCYEVYAMKSNHRYQFNVNPWTGKQQNIE